MHSNSLYNVLMVPIHAQHFNFISHSNTSNSSTPSCLTRSRKGVARFSGVDRRILQNQPCRVLWVFKGGEMSVSMTGIDSEGGRYSSKEMMWLQEAGEDLSKNVEVDTAKKTDWYKKGVSYWEGVEASVDGVLGGYGNVSKRDVQDSNRFLLDVCDEIYPGVFPGNRHLVAVDCGAGVGRVTKNLLLRYFAEVDLVEPLRHFLDAAQADLQSPVMYNGTEHRAVNFGCIPLQDFTPEAGRYDVIWVQWCIGHLTDKDFVSFFQRAKAGLKPSGFFILKENVAVSGFVVDKEDSTVTRSDAYFRDLFLQAGLNVFKSRMQTAFPEGLFSVQMYALTTEMIASKPFPKQLKTRRGRNQPGLIK